MTARILSFPEHPRIEAVRQRERRTVWHRLVEDKAPADQKRLIVDGALYGFLDAHETETLITELGLTEA